MIPTVFDVRGLPVPGLSGVKIAPAPRSGAFHRLFQARLAAPPAAGRVARAVPVPPARLRAFEARPLPAHLTSAPPTVRTAPARRLAGSGPTSAERAALASSIRRSAAAAGVDPALSVAVARAESSLDPRAQSADGLSAGTFQVTYYTKAEMHRKIAAGTVERPPGPDDVALGVGYMRYLDDLFGREAILARGLETVPIEDDGERRLFAVAAFNAGEGRVARAQARAAALGKDPTRFADVEPHLPPITRGYVPRVMRYAREEALGTTVA